MWNMNIEALLVFCNKIKISKLIILKENEFFSSLKMYEIKI